MDLLQLMINHNNNPEGNQVHIALQHIYNIAMFLSYKSNSLLSTETGLFMLIIDYSNSLTIRWDTLNIGPVMNVAKLFYAISIFINKIKLAETSVFNNLINSIYVADPSKTYSILTPELQEIFKTHGIDLHPPNTDKRSRVNGIDPSGNEKRYKPNDDVDTMMY